MLRRFIPDLAAAIRSLSHDKRGNVGIIFGMALMPIVVAFGVTSDFGRITTARELSQSTLDSAVVSAVTAARVALAVSAGTEADVASALNAGQLRGAADLAAISANVRGATVTGRITLNKNGSTIVGVGNLTLVMDAFFMTAVGQNRLVATATSTAQAVLAPYTNIYMMLDTSQSMGIAASDQAAKDLFNIVKAAELAGGDPTPVGCVFACHDKHSNNFSDKNYFDLAASAGIPLRIDTLRNAVTDLIATAKTLAAGSKLFQLGIWTMPNLGSTANLVSLSSDYDRIQAAASTLTLAPTTWKGWAQSYQEEALSDMLQSIPASGSGLTQTSARGFVFIVTDGLRDVISPAPGDTCLELTSHCDRAMDPAVCDGFKSKGLTVAVVYTTYQPIWKDPNVGAASGEETNYTRYVKPHVDNLAPNLRACASGSQWFAEANDDTSIKAAIAGMLEKTFTAAQILR